MSKKIMLLALAVVSAAVFALPAAASAATPIHLTPAPAKGATSSILGGVAVLQQGATTITCQQTTGTITWENGTTGSIVLTFEKECKTSSGIGCSTITTTSLPFHLVTTSAGKPGVLITPGANEHFATFNCGGFFPVVVKGNGIVGEITNPANACTAAPQATSTITFTQAGGVQGIKTVAGTATTYNLKASFLGGEFKEAGQSGSGVVTFKEGAKDLECT